MELSDANYEVPKPPLQDRRRNNFRIDKSVNITTIISSVVLLWTIVTGMNNILEVVKKNINRTNIMWSHFIREHKDITPEELVIIGDPQRESER